MTPIAENFPVPVETQLLRDMNAIVARIEELIDPETQIVSDRTLIALLELALTMESTFAVWCWCHVHLEQISLGPTERISFRSRAEAAVEDADRLARRLHQITGTPFRLEWMPSANAPFSAEGWTLSNSIRDHIALAADRIALDSYGKLIEYAKKHNVPDIDLFLEIACTRKKRVGALAG